MTKDQAQFFRLSLDTLDLESDLDFQSAVQFALDYRLVNVTDLAREFRVSKVTVDRWQNGESAPEPILRMHVYGYLKDKLSEAHSN